jgi:diguanylate cyclase (GGDEF)-like protein
LRNAERSQWTVAVCFIDLDGFKAVNDQYGHDAGDALLKEVALRMTVCMRVNDFVARLGGDEFVVILNDLESVSAIDVALRRLLDVLCKPISVGPDIEVTIGASIGVSTYPEHGQDGDSLMHLADQAMYLAKRSGKNRFTVYSRTP